MAQGKLTEAQAAYRENLAISRRLAEQDPSNAGWQRELAVAHSRVGGVLQTQGKLTEPMGVFGGLGDHPAAGRRRTRASGWQSGFGGGAQPRGRGAGGAGQADGGEAAFGEDLAISRRLAEQDPSNAGWQSGLAAAHNRVGGVLEAQGKLTEAQAAFRRPWRSAGGWPSRTRATPAGNGFGGGAQPRGRGAGGAGQAGGGAGGV